MRNLTTKQMIEIFKLKQLGFDFMGYKFSNVHELSYHHLIIAKKVFRDVHLTDVYPMWNGAILKQITSHNYLHMIGIIDRDVFAALTMQMFAMNQKEYLDMENLRKIDDILNSFEKEYLGKRQENGRLIIQPKYLKRVLSKK